MLKVKGRDTHTSNDGHVGQDTAQSVVFAWSFLSYFFPS